MYNLYLAGPIDGYGYDFSTDWREYVRQTLFSDPIDVFSPMRSKTFLAGTRRIEGSYEDHALASEKGITTHDRFDVMRADIVLANFLNADHCSSGTPIEFGWADAFDIPIVMVMEEEGNPFDHPMIRAIAGFRVTTLYAGIDICKAILLP